MQTLKKKSAWLVIVPFFVLLLALLILGLRMPDESYGEAESRKLAQRPALSLALTDFSSFSRRWDDYTVDQFPFRAELLRDYSAIQKALGKMFARDVYILDDGWMLSPIYRSDPQQLEAYAEALKKAQAAVSVPIVSCVLPEKNDVLHDLAPKYYDNSINEQNLVLLMDALDAAEIPAIDVGKVFLELPLAERKDCYYKTDFHWNHRGACLAAEEICGRLAELGILEPEALPNANAFLWKDLSAEHRYQGDLNRRFSNVYPMQEQIPFYEIAQNDTLRYYDKDGPVSREALVGSGLQETVLDYNGLSTYNLGYWRVENPGLPEGRHVLILKDSFQNACSDYLTAAFASMTVVDPRYADPPLDLQTLIRQSRADLILLMYHQDNLSPELIDFLNR